MKCQMCNKDLGDDRRRKYCATCKSMANKKKARLWRERNRQHVREYHRGYRTKHKKKILKQQRAFHERNPDRRRKMGILSGRKAYRHLVDRCCDPKHIKYRYYGARGVRCLLSWEDFKILYFRTNHCELCNTILNDDNRSLKNGRTIDRIDRTGNYIESNCRIICRSCNSRLAAEVRWRSK